MVISKDKIKVIEVEKKEDLLRFKRDWENILRKSKETTFFQSFEWNLAWINSLKGLKKIKVIIFKDREDVIGIIPLFLRQENGFLFVELVGTRGSDYSNFVILPKYLREVLELFLEWCSFKGIATLRIEEFPKETESFKMLVELIAVRKDDFLLRKSCDCYKIYLPSDWQTYLSSLSKRAKQDILYDRRYLGKCLNYKYNRSYSRESLEKHMKLHQKRWNKEGIKGSYNKKETKDFFINLLKSLEKSKQRLLIEELIIKNRVIASFLAVGFKNNYGVITMAYDAEMRKFSPGKILLGLSIEKAIEAGFKSFDLSRGFDPYKLKFNPKEFENKNIFIFFKAKSKTPFQNWYKTYSQEVGFEPNKL